MAKKNLLVHLDMNKQELQNAKAQNLTTAQRTTLAATLVAGDKGFFVYDTTLNKLFAWSGTAFENVTPAPPQIGQYRGGVAHTAAEPASLVSGDWVVFTSAGVVTNFGGTETVQIGDWAIYNGTTWNILQGNVDVATETKVGLVQLATNIEVSVGTDDTKAVTPLKLKTLIQSKEQNFPLTLVANVTSTTAVNGDVRDVVFQQNVGGKFIPVELDWAYDPNTFSLEVTSNVNITVSAKVTFVTI